MNNTYEPVIGLEVHVELKTNTKMFCRCSADYFGKDPNTHTCPVCLGLPGALPYINKQAIEQCMRIGLALNCKIQEPSLFERKNYFYPDLAKGYQISQYRFPLCVGGSIDVVDKDGKVGTIRINRVHQEEDTAKLFHSKGTTLIDFNRSGVPLVEIVTEPDFYDSAQVRDYAKKLQQIFRYLGVSNADMEKGEMRLEANVSVRPIALGSQLSPGEAKLPNYRVELKNINSFRFMVAAIEYEIKRQIEALEKGEKLVQETRGWNEAKKETYSQRSKEEAHDYRYFPDPDLPQLSIKEQVLSIKETIPELPQQKMKRYMTELGLSRAQAAVLIDSQDLALYFEDVVEEGKKKQVSASEIANYIINRKVDIKIVKPAQIIEDILSKKVGIMKDEGELGKLVSEVILENPKAVQDYQKGKVAAMQMLIGAVMRKSSGKAHIEKVKLILRQQLG